MIPRLYPFKHLDSPIVNKNKREWLHEYIDGNQNLLICIGDSWTWGDGLGNTNKDHNDAVARYNNFYIGLLAKKLKSDWLMIAKCGTNNQWILEQYEIIKLFSDKGMYKNYKKVYVHVCLTELFRELENDVLNKQITDSLNNFKNFDELCAFYFKITVSDKIKNLFPIPKTHFFSKNFWNIPMPEHQDYFIPDSWQQVLFNKSGIEDRELLPVLSSIGIDPLVNLFKGKTFQKFQNEFSELLCIMDKRINNMLSCKYNGKKDTRHPTAAGHVIWADHLYGYYKGA